jgi:hypothetical protein
VLATATTGGKGDRGRGSPDHLSGRSVETPEHFFGTEAGLLVDPTVFDERSRVAAADFGAPDSLESRWPGSGWLKARNLRIATRTAPTVPEGRVGRYRGDEKENEQGEETRNTSHETMGKDAKRSNG